MHGCLALRTSALVAAHTQAPPGEGFWGLPVLCCPSRRPLGPPRSQADPGQPCWYLRGTLLWRWAASPPRLVPRPCCLSVPYASSLLSTEIQASKQSDTPNAPTQGVQVTSDETAAASGQLSPVHWDRTGLLLQPRHLVAGTFRWARRPSMPACRPRGRYPAGALRCAGRREGCTGSTSEDPRAGHRESRTEPASGVCPRHRSI